MLDSILFWLWLAGFCIMSLPVFFGWLINSALLGDSCDTWWRRKMFAWYTFVGFVTTWLWPIGVAGFILYGINEKRRKRKWNKVWNHKKATVPNYWRNAYLVINGSASDIEVRVLDWEFSKFSPGQARLAISQADSRFWADGKETIVYWPNADLEFLPEKEKI